MTTNKERTSSGNEKLANNTLFKYLSFLKDKSDAYESKALYFIVLFSGFVVYTLSYVFFYGYYFGGESGNTLSVVQVIINPVPFNFKSLITIGTCLIIVIALFINVMIKTSKSLTEKSISILVDFLTLSIITVVSQACFTLIFMGKPNFSTEYTKVFIFAALTILYYAMNISGKLAELGYGVIITIIAMFLFGVVYIAFKIQLSVFLTVGILLWIWIGTSILCVYFNIRKTIIYSVFFIVTYFGLGTKFKFEFISVKSAIAILVIIGLLVLISYLWKICAKRIESLTASLKKQKRKVNKTINLNEKIRSGLAPYKFSLFAIGMLIIIGISYSMIFSFGQVMANNMSIVSYEEITYKLDENNHKTIIGQVVSQKDDVFYISNEKRELIIIKNSDVHTKPYSKTTKDK